MLNEKIAGISGLVLLILGTIGIIGSMIVGSIDVYLILIVPVFVFKGVVPVISIVSISIGGSVILFSRFYITRTDHSELKTSDDGGQKRSIEGGGIIFIGPIPIVFGSKAFKDGLPSWFKLLIVGIIVSFIFIILFIAVYHNVYWGVQ